MEKLLNRLGQIDRGLQQESGIVLRRIFLRSRAFAIGNIVLGVAVAGFCVIAIAIFFSPGTSLQSRLARNDKAMANRAALRRWFRTAVTFSTGCLVPFSFQHK